MWKAGAGVITGLRLVVLAVLLLDLFPTPSEAMRLDPSATCDARPTAQRTGCGPHSNCGNGALDSAEQCDDANTVPFDGCSADCLLEVDIQVMKTESIDPVVAGSGMGNLTYVVSATNAGFNHATSVALSETLTLPPGVTIDSITPSAGSYAPANASPGVWNIGTLLAGTSETLTVVLTVDASTPPGPNVISNTATVISVSELDTNTTNDTASESTTVVAEADISVTKDDGLTTAVPGLGLTYTIVVANAGPSDDPSVALVDNFPAALICTYTSAAAGGATGNTAAGAGDLNETLFMPAGSSVTYTVDCTIAPGATGTLTNTATATPSTPDPEPANNSATDDDTVLTPMADISVTKTDGVTTAVPGGNLTYTIVVTNAGPSDDPSVSLVDAFPAALTCTYTSMAAGGAMGNTPAGAGNLNETLSMPAGSSVTYTVDCAIDPAATGTLSNTVTATSSVTDPDGSNNAATDDDTVLTPMADVSVTKDDGVGSAVPGQDMIIYTIVVANAGPSDDPSVSLVDTFPAALNCTFTSVAAGGATGNTAAGAGDLNETLSLPAGSSVTYTVTCTIDPAATGTLSNTATATPSVADPNGGNNSATDDDTLLTPFADLSIAKDDDIDPIVAGNTLSYTVTATNNGPSDATNVVVADALPAGVTFGSTTGCAEDPAGVPTCTLGTIASGASAPFTIQVVVDAGTSGTITNNASASSDVPDTDASNNSGDEDTMVNAPICGNSIVETPLELCDDGNAMGGDGCSATCAPESGFLCTGAPSMCQCAATVEVCGDGIDNDCDGEVDAADAGGCETCFCAGELVGTPVVWGPATTAVICQETTIGAPGLELMGTQPGVLTVTLRTTQEDSFPRCSAGFTTLMGGSSISHPIGGAQVDYCRQSLAGIAAAAGVSCP